MASRHERVLVVGADRALRARVCAVLEAAGYDVRAVLDARAARRSLARWQPSAILLDVAAPPPDLWMIADAHARGRIAHIPLVTLGAPGSPGSPGGLPAELAPSATLADPLDVPDLIATVWVVTNS